MSPPFSRRQFLNLVGAAGGHRYLGSELGDWVIAYRLPAAPGYSVELRPESVRAHLFPSGAAWRGDTT